MLHFSLPKLWLAAEVKSRISDEQDLVRGLFQCVKYCAVMEAEQLAGSGKKSVQAILILESYFPRSPIPLSNLLGVKVYENVRSSS